ncbi:asparaginase [Arvimicrobium flavum]|uniref:asparaginase n=1 Tax=Arvimicrobium flavum TaxID=3393320 RepID=UPI00237B3637|nr:asparaginase [Mesorhizobium shangrilense]
MTDPVLVEVTRGGMVESRHRGAVAVCDADGKLVLAIGEIEMPVFPRSAVKAIQALPLVESGAADALGFDDRELALACASHSGEPEHAELARGMLGKVSLDNAALECGAHWPSDQDAMVTLARDGRNPLALHNNCSGKHAGFICTCCHAQVDPRGYIRPDHWLQENVRVAMEEVTGAPHGEANRGTDGCSIPTYAVPLSRLAHGFARMATGRGLGVERAKAARRLLAACMAHPFYTSGSGRMDTRLMQAAPGRIFVKTGAEGVYCAALPELGLGIALKCDDGAGRAAEVAVATVLAKLLSGDAALAERLRQLASPTLSNWNGIEVGSLRPSDVLM